MTVCRPAHVRTSWEFEFELDVEIQVMLEVELELVEVTPWLRRRDRASSTALWTAWETAEAIDLENSSDMFVFSHATDLCINLNHDFTDIKCES